ncbi:MAG: hypothetical protein Q7S40_06035 [Opitutaceae bacterium]|nr:hypothetical protein [Opitutaceae bacterium]
MLNTNSTTRFGGRAAMTTSRRSALAFLTVAIAFGIDLPAFSATKVTKPAPLLQPIQTEPGQWGVAVSNAGLASASRLKPVEIELWSEPNQITSVSSGYTEVVKKPDGFNGKAMVRGPNSSLFTVEDEWRQDGSVVRLSRSVKVSGSATEGFMSGFQFDFTGPRAWTDAEWFAPGMIYGGFEHLTKTAIGGQAHYQPGNYTVRIREDRLPAPLFLAHFSDRSSIAILNPSPKGGTTAAEGNDVQAVAMMNSAFQFGAIGAQERGGKLSVGYWFPGSEGQVTYAGNTYPGGQLHAWRRRYHPVQDGWAQQYAVRFRIGSGDSFPDTMASVWRWAWQALQPAVERHDVTTVRRVLIDMLAANVIEKEGWSGIPLFINAATHDLKTADRRALMGFCGKNLEAVNYLLQEAALEPGPRSVDLRRKAEAIAASFVRLKMSPPQGEGFNLDDGTPVSVRERKDGMMYLRSFGDDLKMLLDAYVREKALGREHPAWLAWCREFADWLLPQQQQSGGFPRSWKAASAEIGSASANASFNAVPLLVRMHRITGEQPYLTAAVRAADFCWTNGQSRGRFVGGTIDNPDVLDKEAATISLEAYLALYEATRDRKWLACARGAANYAETWIYLWNVPMPVDDTALNLHWKTGASTVGVQLIASGHSLVDQYMSFDADDFAKLYKYTGDVHYYEVSRLLLHSTKSMLALPGRTYDLGGPGWQQEHWSLAPRRGRGLHRGWLPWVSTSHLNGIFGLMNLDADLFGKLSRAEDQP